MAFKKIVRPTLSVSTPESMLHDIRTKKIEGPLARQADVWREYVDSALELPDVAIRLPTGSGKTLVGIVLGEWRRRKFGERVVYLCPTNQLVHQVVEQARNQYGIDVASFTGTKSEYALDEQNAYRRKEKIAVTSYSALFNTHPYFDNPEIVILDDAHSAENYISSMYSLVIDRRTHGGLYETIVSLLENNVPEVDLSKATEVVGMYSQSWMEKLPSASFMRVRELLTPILDAGTNNTQLYWPWSLLRGHLQACHLYISTGQILIRPLFPPIHTHAPFNGAKQRIYMSATLGNGGDLERITGRSRIHRLKPASMTDEQGIGRRLFVFPEVSLDETETESLIENALEIFGRALFITPSDKDANERKEKIEALKTHRVYKAGEIEVSKKEFTSREKAAAVIANRYDGMDFPHDECRLLILEGLPKAANLQERFLLSKMGCNVLLNDRIQTRIVQAVGRCTRANSDYAAVVVKGNEWLDYLLTHDNTQYLDPEIQAEIDFGERQSDATAEDIIENLRIFKKQSVDWVEANNEIVEFRSEKNKKTLPEMNELELSVVHELKYLHAIWRGDHTTAFDHCRNVLSIISSPSLKGYRALWNYLAGAAVSLAYQNGQVGEDGSKEFYAEAMKSTIAITWLVDLAKNTGANFTVTSSQDSNLPSMVEKIEARLLDFGVKNNKRFNLEYTDIIQGLTSTEAKLFERSQVRLGHILGFESDNSERRAAPDPWWIIDKKTCVVFEDHTNATADILSVEKARQAFCHDNWIRENVSGLESECIIIKVLVTPVTKVALGGKEHLRDVYHMTPEEFRVFAARALGAIREIRGVLLREGDLDWRARAMALLDSRGLTPNAILDLFREKIAGDVLAEE
ncbi:DEAD/DEAH box helicase [Pseudomonas capsici]|uniref:DEAD/DEAH box helicase n=1 Tax=Pseudomonas capsici TaxID=2810614 RepID=UPI0021F0D968|nr:DEAD/DEAH box helicase [Pseudomonas capsici]MCV4273449.1 DEAD/DEAH box helicase [Pseudomonas capsici]